MSFEDVVVVVAEGEAEAEAEEVAVLNAEANEDLPNKLFDPNPMSESDLDDPNDSEAAVVASIFKPVLDPVGYDGGDADADAETFGLTSVNDMAGLVSAPVVLVVVKIRVGKLRLLIIG